MTAAAAFRRAALLASLAVALPLGYAAAQTTAKPQNAKPDPIAQQAPSDPEGAVVAKLGAREVKLGELQAHLASLGARERAAIDADPALMSQVVRAYLANELVYDAAIARKWDQRADVIARVEKARRQVVADSFLDAASQPPADYPSDAEVQALYDANSTQFVTPRQFQIAQVFVAAPDKASEEKARARLNDILSRLKQPGAAFETIVKDGPGKEAGDRSDALGWVPETQLRPEIREHVAGLAKGAVGAPLKLEDGWHILRLIDTRPAATLPVASVRDQLVQKLRAERAAQLRRAVVQDLSRKTPTAINELALSRVQPAAGDAGEPR